MSTFINPNDSVLDLGCGKMWLKEYLKETNMYFPSDYIKRSNECEVVDFNKRQFPKISVNVVFASGVLEYVDNPQWFVNEINKCSFRCIISYCSTNYFPDINNRKSLKWVNNFSEVDLIELFTKYNFVLKEKLLTDTNNSIFVFDKL